MDQDPLEEEIESGRQLIEALSKEGFAVFVAFWARLFEEEEWHLYIASPFVNENGPRVADLLIHRLLRETPELRLETLDVKVLQSNDSLAEKILTKIKPKIHEGPFADRDFKPTREIIRMGRTKLGYVGIDHAYIYPQSQPMGSR